MNSYFQFERHLILWLFQPNTKGLALLNKVFDHLNLVEKEYFGLRYVDNVHQTVSQYWNADLFHTDSFVV